MLEEGLGGSLVGCRRGAVVVGRRRGVVFDAGAGDELDVRVDDLRGYFVGLQEFEGALLEFGDGGWWGRHGGWRVVVGVVVEEGGGGVAAVGVEEWRGWVGHEAGFAVWLVEVGFEEEAAVFEGVDDYCA